MGETIHGGMAELCRVRAHQLVRLPDAVSFVEAAALPCAYGTAHRMMVTNGNVAAGEKVLILGASGGVGVCCVQLAKLAGATVIACAGSETKAQRLRDLGADATINYLENDFVQEVYALYGKPARRGAGIDRGVDVVVNYTGGDTWTKSLRVLRVGGRLLTCGATAGYDPKEDIRFIWTFELKILGANGWMRSDVERLLQLVAGQKLKALVDETFPLDHAAEALQRLERSQRVRQAGGDAVSDVPLSRERLQQMLRGSPAIEAMGLEVLSADPATDTVVMRAAMRPEFERMRGSGQWHGGPIAALIDTVGDYALVMVLGKPLPTINMRVDYLRPAVNTTLILTGRIRRNGRSVGVVDIDVANEAGALVAIGRAAYATG